MVEQRIKIAYFDGKACAKCGDADRKLTLDHIDPAQKVTHKVWSWAAARREAELAKCQPLCAACHVEKSRADTSPLTRAQVEEIRATVSAGAGSIASLARTMGMKPRALQRIVRGDRWAHGFRPGWAGITAVTPAPAVSR